jgi:hypothetical protein
VLSRHPAAGPLPPYRGQTTSTNVPRRSLLSAGINL